MNTASFFRKASILFGFMLILTAGCCRQAWAEARSHPPAFRRDTLMIQPVSGPAIPFDIEIATTEQQHAYGLMARDSLPERTGMLFMWDADQPVAMWMKDTYIALDMLFVTRSGVITRIAADAKPFDLTPIPSGGPVRAVIEINGGEARRLGIKPGARVLYSAFPVKP